MTGTFFTFFVSLLAQYEKKKTGILGRNTSLKHVDIQDMPDMLGS